jgi:peptidoglycan/xylan/chitin deacetylase (PgdA/CDA1 family)
MNYAQRWLGSVALEALGRSRTDRQRLYGGAHGLRILVFHDLSGAEFDHFRALVEWALERMDPGVPEDADALLEGRFPPPPRDRLLLSFDDGFESHFRAAEWMARRGLRGSFFVVPSLVGRDVDGYVAHHRARGVEAFRFSRNVPGLAPAQVCEMDAMGHRIGAHNHAHRDLGRLHAPADVAAEIEGAVKGVSAVLGRPCRDFAIAFGQPANISAEARRQLLAADLRVYSCVRGLNVPGRTPRFLLRHTVDYRDPGVFIRLCIRGGADRHLARAWSGLLRDVGPLPTAPA